MPLESVALKLVYTFPVFISFLFPPYTHKALVSAATRKNRQYSMCPWNLWYSCVLALSLSPPFSRCIFAFHFEVTVMRTASISPLSFPSLFSSGWGGIQDSYEEKNQSYHEKKKENNFCRICQLLHHVHLWDHGVHFLGPISCLRRRIWWR